MAIDTDRCIGCRTCAVICKDCNAQPEGIWWNRVFTQGTDEHETAVAQPDGSMRMDFLPVACQHCDDAPCVGVCPTQASYIDDNGTVLVDFEKCIGCRYCMTACPYGVRQFNWTDPVKLKGLDQGAYSYGYPVDYRDKDGHLVYTPNRPVGVAEKCTFCAQYVSQGLDPMCCQGCPGNARIFGDLDDPASPVSRYLESHEVRILGEEYHTVPKVFYVSRKRRLAEDLPAGEGSFGGLIAPKTGKDSGIDIEGVLNGD